MLARHRRYPFALAAALVVGTTIMASHTALAQRSSIPDSSYYVGLQDLYENDYRDALRTFTREVRSGGVKIGVQTKWVDSVCYYAMLGETLYHYGQFSDALEQFDLACSLYLQNPQWLLRVNFDNSPPRPMANVARTPVPWGVSQRRATPAQFGGTMLVQMGRIDNSDAVRRGGAVQVAQFWNVDVVEIMRCTALAMCRRNELLGPLGKYNDLSKDLSATLIRPGAPPNHWSNTWLELLRGIAHVGVGENQRALQYLDRSVLLLGQYDHPLTCIALVEQGKLAMAAGDFAAANQLFAEAGYSAYRFEDIRTVDDAFRLAETNRLASGVDTVDPALQPAANWARAKGFDHVFARLNFSACEEFMERGDLSAAMTALQAGQSRLQDARSGLLGVAAANLEARLDYHLKGDAASEKLAAAVNLQKAVSIWNFQINMANVMFDAQSLPASAAGEVYSELLRDPTALDLTISPPDVLAVLKSPHDASFSRWLTALLERRDIAGALEVSDRAKRRRYLYALPWGGRLASVRELATAPPERQSPDTRQMQGAMLAQFPALQGALSAEEQAYQQIDQTWQRGVDEQQQVQIGRSWRDFGEAFDAREALLRQISLQRVPAEFSFPPMLTTDQVQARLRPGQAILVFHDTAGSMYGFLFTAEASIAWDCGPSSLLQRRYVEPLLRELGNYDANRELTPEQLNSDQWQESAQALYEALLSDSSLDPAPLEDLVIVPDGPIWYVPFETLMVKSETSLKPLMSYATIRYAPTVGLALSNDGPLRRVQRTGVVAGDLIPGDSEEAKAAVVESIDATLTRAFPLAPPLPSAAPLTASLLDQLLVLEDVETEGAEPMAFSPLPLDRSKAVGSLLAWTALARHGPQRIYLPGMHTVAERGGRVARRRGASAAPGAELFFASCGLIASGAETMLLSRWRVGGQTTIELVREFAQEAPHAAAGEAWRRAVNIVRATPIDPLAEPRVKDVEDQADLTATHPFFWAGYLVVDTGWAPEPEQEDQPAAAAGGSPPGMQSPAAKGTQGADAARPLVDVQSRTAQRSSANTGSVTGPDAAGDAIGIPVPNQQLANE